MNVDQVIAGYIRLRDQRDALKKKHTEELRPVTERMTKLEMWLQNHLNTLGLNSLKGESGTAFLKEVTSATVEDGEVFINFIRENEMWELIERRCSKSVVDDYVSQKGTLPPGVKYSRETVCQIRRG
jgi:hypothetical protein